MKMPWIRPVLSVVAALCSGVALAGPIPGPSLQEAASRFDASFQDGRTSSLIGHGTPNAMGVIETGDPDDLGPIATCFSSVNPPSPEAMAAVEAAIHGYQGRYLLNGSWGAQGSGTPITITWSFVPDGLSIPGGAGEPTANSVLFSRMDSLFGNSRATWIQQFQNCFDRWGALSGLSYVRVKDAANDDWDDGAAWGTGSGTNRGMVRISMHNIDGGNGILAYCQFPTNGDMVIDSSENWAQSGGSYLFLRNVVMHEHGHGLGFLHVCPANQTKLMEPFVSTAYDGPQQDELRAVAANYGDPYEPNNSSTAAYDLGTLAPGSTTTLGNVPAPSISNGALLAISNATDVDFFKLNVAEPRLVDATITPFGSTYPALAQDSACSATTPTINSLTMANLVLTITNSNGSTVLRTIDANPAGQGETISGLLCSTGVSFVKVSASSETESQLYKLTVTVRGTSLSPSVSQGTFTDHVHISWPAIADATSYIVYRNTTDAHFGGTTLATLSPPTTSFDDTTAVPGHSNFYYVEAQQPGNTGYRFMNDAGITGYINVPPVANAGPDQTVIDADNNGSEPVTLDGSASSDTPPGTILVYRWTEGATLLAQNGTPTAVVTLPVGQHTITLTVTDNNSAQSTDTVVISVVPPTSSCGSADFNCDGDVGTDSDIEAFFACLAGNCPSAPCTSNADFNGDGDTGTDADIEAFFRVLAGGTC